MPVVDGARADDETGAQLSAMTEPGRRIVTSRFQVTRPFIRFNILEWKGCLGQHVHLAGKHHLVAEISEIVRHAFHIGACRTVVLMQAVLLRIQPRVRRSSRWSAYRRRGENIGKAHALAG